MDARDQKILATIRRILDATPNRRAAVSSVAEFLRFNSTPGQRVRLWGTANVGVASQAAVPHSEQS